jgi:hypothetical protein
MSGIGGAIESMGGGGRRWTGVGPGSWRGVGSRGVAGVISRGVIGVGIIIGAGLGAGAPKVERCGPMFAVGTCRMNA